MYREQSQVLAHPFELKLSNQIRVLIFIVQNDSTVTTIYLKNRCHLICFSGLAPALFISALACIALATNQVVDASLASHIIVTGSATNLESSLAVSGNYLYIIWIQAQPNTPENSDTYGTYSDVFFKVSDDYGSSFSGPVQISTGPGKTIEANIAVTGSDVYVVWSKRVSHEYDNTDVFFASSHDNGKTFGTVLNLASGPNVNHFDRISAVGNKVYVLWTGDDGIQMRISYDGGGTFSEPHIISYLWNGQLLVEENNVYTFACQSDSFHFVASHDGGRTSDSSLNMTGNPWCLDVPEIAASGNDVFVSWTNGSSYQTPIRTLLAVSRDLGRSFEKPVVLSEFPAMTEGAPFFQDGISQTNIATYGNYVYVIWNNFDGFGRNNILFRASNDSGVSFGPSINLSKGDDDSKRAALIAFDKYVYLAWTNLVTNSVLLRASNDNGQSFDDAVNLSTNDRQLVDVKIGASSGNIYAIWTNGNATSDNNEMNQISFVKVASEDLSFFHKYPNRTVNSIPFTIAPDRVFYNETGIIKIKGQIPVLVEPRPVHISISYLKGQTESFTRTLMPESDGTYNTEIRVE